MKAWLAHHLQSLRTAAARFRAAPLATLFTVLVIGIAVALPAGLYALLLNLDRAAGGARPLPELTLFLKADVGAEQGARFAAALKNDADVADTRFISRDDGIRKLEAMGLGDIAAGLPDNPLPHSIIVTPATGEPERLEALRERLAGDTVVERVMLDAAWIKRLDALLGLGRDLVFLLAVLLGLALAAITANTIRLQIYAQRDEIEVAQLIGATDRFIRRPFLYFGAIQGVSGGLAGWCIVMLAGLSLQAGVAAVAAAYGVDFRLAGFGLGELLPLLAISAALGWLGAYFAVSRALREMEKF
jgi:cell division transport system permease protein